MFGVSLRSGRSFVASAWTHHIPVRQYNEVEEEDKISKKRYVLITSYLGTHYRGVQINDPISDTIQGVIHEALNKLEWIRPEHFAKHSQVSWNQCSRTDKGVHCLFNVLSCKMKIPETRLDLAVAKLNEVLPKDIKILDIKAVSRSFKPRNFTGGRIYEYLMPTKAFKPSVRNTQYDTLSNWEFSEVDVMKLNELCRLYVGSNKFHNFTKKVRYSQDSARRHIVGMNIEDVIVSEGVEFARFIIQGDSFLFHQIRKMIGLVTCMYRDGAPFEIIPAVLKGNYGNWLIPLAPAPFLQLSSIDFTPYNKYIRNTTNRDIIDRQNYRKQINEYQRDVVFPHIASLEKEQNLIGRFIEENTLQIDYDYFLRPYLKGEAIPPPETSLRLIKED